MDHAKILLRHLFRAAGDHTEPVRIVSGRLRRDFYNDLVADAEQTLQKAKVSVVVLSNEQLKDNPFYEVVKNHPNGDVRVLGTDPVSYTHFLVVGERRYRVEHDDGKHTAYASFNNEVIPPLLIEYFDHLHKRANAA